MLGEYCKEDRNINAKSDKGSRLITDGKEEDELNAYPKEEDFPLYPSNK